MSEFDFDLDFDEQTVGAFRAIPTQANTPAEKDDDPFNFANINMADETAPVVAMSDEKEISLQESQISSFGTFGVVDNKPADDPFDFTKPMEAAPLEYASAFDIKEASTPVAPVEVVSVNAPIELMDDDFDEKTVGAFSSIPPSFAAAPVAQVNPVAPASPVQNGVSNRVNSATGVNNAFARPTGASAVPSTPVTPVKPPVVPVQNNAPTSVQDINNAFRKPAGAPITPVAPAKTVAPTQNTPVNAPTSVQDINDAFRKPGSVPEAQPVQPGTISSAAKAVLQKEMEKTKKSGIKMLVGAVVLLLFFPISIPLAIGGAGKLKKASQIKKQIEQG